MKLAPPVCLALLLVLLTFRSSSTAHAAASSVLIGQSCFSSGVSVAIAWSAGDAPVLQQFVDVSLEDNGWLPGTYSPQGPLAAGVTSFVLHSLPAGRYYVRINQMLPNGTLEASETQSFVTMVCDPNPPVLAVANDNVQPTPPAPSTATPPAVTPPAETASAAASPDTAPAFVNPLESVLSAAALAAVSVPAGSEPLPPSLLAAYPPYFPACGLCPWR